MDKPSLLLVGGSGSLGTSLLKTLKSEFSIYVIDKNPPKDYECCRYFLCDIADLKLTDIDIPDKLIVLYLAGNLTNSLDKNDVLNSINDNITSLANFIVTFYEKIKHMIFVSSVSVYGIPKYNPIDEKHVINPFSLYGSQKTCAEIICKTLCGNFHIPLTIIRSSQLFGLASADTTLPHILLNNLKLGKPVSLTGDPYSERDYLHISDFSTFVCDVLKQPVEGIFNIGSGKGIRLIDLFKIAYETFGIPFEMDDVISNKTDFSFSQVLDISLAHQVYSFEPKYSIKKWFYDCVKIE